MISYPNDERLASVVIRGMQQPRLNAALCGYWHRYITEYLAKLRAEAVRTQRGLECERDEAREELAVLRTPRPRDEWKESDGAVLWWSLPIREPPYVGTEADDDFPEYATHWTPLPRPVAPADAKETP